MYRILYHNGSRAMMTTHHGRAVEETVDAIVRDDQEMTAVLAEGMGKLARGEFDPAWVSAVMQKPSLPGVADRFTMDDAHAFLAFHDDVLRGKVGVTRLAVGQGPRPDSEVDANNALLSEILSPFRATFSGGLADCDGFLSWDRPIVLDRNRLDQAGEIILDRVEVQPGCVPLEVGFTQASRSLIHLRKEGLARWPYGSDRIWLFVRLPKYQWEGLDH